MRQRAAAGALTVALALTAALPSLWLGSVWLAGDVHAASEMEFSELTIGDLEQSEAQRERVRELARRHVGPPPNRTLSDLRLLQRLVDLQVVDRDDTFDSQAMGLVLGDVMAAQLPLRWVVVVDQYGRSRALRYKQTENVFFPVTMISKRLERDAPIDVQQLYDRVRAEVEALEQGPRRTLR